MVAKSTNQFTDRVGILFGAGLYQLYNGAEGWGFSGIMTKLSRIYSFENINHGDDPRDQKYIKQGIRLYEYFK